MGIEHLNSMYEDLVAQISEDLSLDDKNTHQYRQYQDQLLDVRTALEQIRDNDGVSQSMIASLESHLPEHLPLKSFTRSPTHTNLQDVTATLEERNWGLIAAVGVAIASLIARIVMFIFDRKSASGSAEKNAETAVKMAESNEEVARNAPVDKVAELVKSIDEKANQNYNRFVESCTMDIDTRNTASPYGLLSLGEELISKNSLRTLLAKAVGSIKRQAALQEIDTLRQSIEMEVSALKLVGKGQSDLKEAVDLYKANFAQDKEDRPKNAFQIKTYNQGILAETASVAVVARKDRKIELDVSKFDKLKKGLTKIQSDLDGLNFDKIEKDLGKNLAEDAGVAAQTIKAYQDLLELIRNTVMGMLQFFRLREEILATDTRMYAYIKQYQTALKEIKD